MKSQRSSNTREKANVHTERCEGSRVLGPITLCVVPERTEGLEEGLALAVISALGLALKRELALGEELALRMLEVEVEVAALLWLCPGGCGCILVSASVNAVRKGLPNGSLLF